MAPGDKFRSEGGLITLPVSVVKVLRVVGEKTALAMQNTTGPGDDGNVEWTEGNYAYRFAFQGVLVEGDQPTDTTNGAVRASGQVQFGNGEVWAGTMILRNIQSSPDWGPGGAIGVSGNGVFTGPVTVSHPT